MIIFENCNRSRRWLHNRFLLDYNYFRKYYNIRAVDISKQQATDADPKVVEQINFTGNLEQ